MGGKTEDVGKTGDYKFMDPTGRFAGTYDAASNQHNQNMGLMGQYGQQAMAAGQGYDPNAYMNQFMNQSGDLSNLVNSQNGQLQGALNAIAGRQAQLGGEAALAAMPGGANSGAGMAAFGQAYADPFAQAQAQLQQNQLQGTLGLWNQAMGANSQNQLANTQFQIDPALQMAGQYGQQAANNFGVMGQLGSESGAWYQPTYQYQKGAWDYTKDAVGMGTDIAGAFKGK